MTTKHDKHAWLRAILDPLRPVARELLTASLFINVLALAAPIFVMQVYDRVIGHSSMETLKGLVIGMAIVLVFDYVLRQSRARIMQMVSLRIDVEVGTRLFDKLMRLPLRTLEGRSSAVWQQLFRDVDTLRATLSGSSAILLADLPFVLIFLGVIFIIGRPLALVFLVVFALFILLAWRSGKSLSDNTQRDKNVTATRDALVAEIVAGRGVVKSVGLGRAVRPLWEDKHASAIEHAIQRGATADGYVNLGSELTQMASVLLTTVGAVFIIDHELSMGALIACNMLSSRLYGPINQLVGAWRTFGGFRQSLERLSALFAEAEDRQDSAIRFERPSGRLTVEGVVFAYEPDAAPSVALERLEITPGGITAVLGRNGSGKTTFLKVLMGLYAPSKGRVLLDGADLAQFGRADLGAWMGYVPQETLLFNASIRDNIAYGAPGCSDEQILAAARAAGVHDAIADLPNGYATLIGEAGSRLSGGQRQRIAIARALVGDPPVLMMDEPSASLDRQAEEELRATMAQLAKSRTVVVVTHSPVLLPVCRDVIVLERGRLLAAGPAGEVLPRLFGPRPPTPQTAPQATPQTHQMQARVTP
ncbi:MAG TPA: ABC transporter transmembrane domain-containing protein [Magnetospirillum sp.]|nr:ABC transporter transmembrane domain-containing protein [Magnetospirillum sp.]